MTLDLKYFKEKLETEKAELEAQLSRVAKRSETNPTDWEPAITDGDSAEADDNVAADNIENYEENVAITNSLETRLNDVKSGLDKIEQGNYGTCQVCGMEIEGDRLEANPAARTCKTHINSL